MIHKQETVENDLDGDDLNTDADLLALFCCHRDEDAFAQLVRRHSRMVLGVCFQVLGHSHDAQDAFQATFLILATKAESIKKETSLASWLYKVAYRTSMRAVKLRQRHRCDLISDEVTVSDDPLQTIHLQSLQLALYEELARIPQSYQGPIVLCYLEGKSRKQAAEELECSDASVKARLSRAKQLLRSRLSRRGIALTVAIASCSSGAALAARTATPDLMTNTVSGCLATLDGTTHCFSSSVLKLVSEGTAMNTIPAFAKYAVAACVSTLAVLTLAWSTTVSFAQTSDVDRSKGQSIVFDVTGTEQSTDLKLSNSNLVADQPVWRTQLPQDSRVHFVADDVIDPNANKRDSRYLFFGESTESGEIRYLKKKVEAFNLLRDAEAERVGRLDSEAEKLEALAKSKEYEAEALRFSAEISRMEETEKKHSKGAAGDGKTGPLLLNLGHGISESKIEALPCCRENNLAYGRSVTASSQETIINNLAQLAVDGDLSTRWCADDDTAGQWIQVDLGSKKSVSNIRIHWEMMDTAYSYKIEVSPDAKDWKTSVDTSKDPKTAHMPKHSLDEDDVRYIRITFLGTDEWYWGSIREIEVTDGPLSEPPTKEWEKVREADDLPEIGFYYSLEA